MARLYRSGPSGLHNERVGADRLIIDSLIEEQRNGGCTWGWDRFGVVLKGDLFAFEDLTIEGRVEGTITVRGQTLTVGCHAQIKAQILARVATIRGTVHGDVTATKRVEILAMGSLDGDIVAPQIAIAEGACFRGNVDVQPGNAEQVLASQSAPAGPRRPETPSRDPRGPAGIGVRSFEYGAAARPSANPSPYGPQELGTMPD